MNATSLSIDGQLYHLDPSVDVGALKARISAVARQGADFVDFSTVAHGLVSALVTASSVVRLQSVPTEPVDAAHEPEETTEWARIDAAIDFDEYAW